MIKALVICTKSLNPLLEKFAPDYGVQLIPVYGQQEAMKEENYDNIDMVICCNTSFYYDEPFFAMLNRKGINKMVQPMTGFNHLNIEAAKKYGVKCANVRAYSPNAIAELTLGMAIGLNRSLFKVADNNQKFAFKQPALFTEIRDCTIGIIGVGAIGLKLAQYFNALEAKVIGYDPYPNDKFKTYGEFVDLEQLKKNSDIISIHVPYMPNENYHMIDDKFIEGMKEGAILINCARGELVDLKAVNAAVKSNKLAGYGADVLEGEYEVFGKEFGSIHDIPGEAIEEALSLYPRIMITPHMGANTTTARSNMMKICLANAVELFETGTCKSLIWK